MKFFNDRSLKRMGLYLLAGVFLILLAEYLVIRYRVEALELVEEKKDFARSVQLNGQQIALLVHEFEAEQKHLAPEIIAQLDEQDRLLKIVKDGGRMDGTDVFLKPLSPLPQLTFNELMHVWSRYKESILATVLPPQAPDIENYTPEIQTPADSTGISDSTALANSIAVTATPSAPVDTPALTKAMLPAQWLSLSNWYKKLEIDLTEEAAARENAVEIWVFVFIFFDLLLLAALYYLYYRFIIRPLQVLKQNTIDLRQDFVFPDNEIGWLTHEINEVLEQLKDATDFVGAIGEGKLDFDYKTLDSQHAAGKNKLADSLIAMQAKLKDMNVEEQRRQWANEGLTKFVDILRSSNDNITTLGDKIISTLVQYTGSNQGGLYVLNDDDENNKYLELISLFAFNIKKYEKQKIKLGEGLLGQTFLEKETTLLTEIPEEYIRITSGLGGANPRAIVAVPLKVDQDVYGMVELASFKVYQPYEIAFVEKLAETIASTLSSVKTAQKNRSLIEQFRQQTEEMRAQEEEMRQNMEELQATQEEIARKERDYLARIQALEAQSAQEENLKLELTRERESHTTQIRQLEQKVADLEAKLALKPSKGDDWQVAEEMEKTLRFQLEALQITREQIVKK